MWKMPVFKMWKLTSVSVYIGDMVDLTEARTNEEDKTFHRPCRYGASGYS